MNETSRVLVVDEDAQSRETLVGRLSQLGFVGDAAKDCVAALEILEGGHYDIALVDIIAPGTRGASLLEAIDEACLDTVPVILTEPGSEFSRVEALKLGAFDHLQKESDDEILRSTTERALSHLRGRRQARRMSETARQWKATFDAVPDLMAIIDTDHRFVRVNRAMAEKLGCRAEDAVGRTCSECVDGLEQTDECCLHAPLVEANHGHATTMTKERPDGHYLISTSPLYGSDGELIGSVHVARDVTEEKKAQEQLQTAHAEMERLVSSMSSFLIEVNMDLRTCRWNATAESTFGLAAEDVLGTPFSDCGIQWNWEAISGQVASWKTAEEPISLPPLRYIRPDGGEGVLGVNVNPIKDEDGASKGFFLLGSDITERTAMEAQLAQAQKLESIGQLAAGIAHEINTPTQYVGDNVEFLQCAFQQLEELRLAYHNLLAAAKAGPVEGDLLANTAAAVAEANVEYLVEQIPRAITQSLDGVRRIASIVRAMKEFSHPGAEVKTRVDLNQCIESTITVSRNEWKYVAEMETDLQSDLPQVVCLPGEFNQVILNILVNAAHAIGDVVGDGADGKGIISVSTRQDSDWAEVRISDTGPGIPEESQARIFDPFYTTKEVGRGTGQGLAIAHNAIVEKHGGTLTFETGAGKGTTFIIRIPIT